MAQSQQFLQEFESSLNKLNQLNVLINKNAEQKQNFSIFVLKRLGEINDKVKALSSGIEELKKKLTDLTQQIETNKSGIANNDKQMQELQKQIEDLNLEKQKLIKQLSELTQTSNQKIQETQDKINAYESKIRDLTNQNETLTTQIKKQDENNEKIKQLQEKIEQQDAEIQKMQNDHATAVSQSSDQLKSLNQTENELKQKIDQLNEQIQQLQNENQDLQKRIVDATKAINNAIENLQDISNDAKDNQNTENISKLFAQVEASIEDISRSIQGQPSQPVTSSVAPVPGTGSNNLLTLSDQVVGINGVPQGFTYKDLLEQLQRKSRAVGPGRPNKYSNALTQLRLINNINEVPKILNENGIIFKNNNIFGGKKYKTKKMRKQKGGFTYKHHSKRKSMSTTSLSFNARGKKRTITKKSL